MSEKSNEACWYVVHTYSGYENKVKDTLEKSIKSSNMQDYIFDVRVPVEEVSEIRKGKRVKSTRKVFPGYVIVNMIKTNESWYVVRNTRGVTGFVGPDGQPVALTPSEVEMMLNPPVRRHGVRFGNRRKRQDCQRQLCQLQGDRGGNRPDAGQGAGECANVRQPHWRGLVQHGGRQKRRGRGVIIRSFFPLCFFTVFRTHDTNGCMKQKKRLLTAAA